jgi:hypothetical protein
MTKIRALTTALAAGAVATAIAVLPAHGQSAPATRTLTFTSTEKQRDGNQVDVRPKGESVGDRFIFSSTLHQAGRVAGRVEGDCVAVDRTYQGLLCSGVGILPDGRIAVQGASLSKRIPGVGGTAEEYVVTGGSGAYQGVTGTMTRKAGRKADTITFVLSG